MILEIMKLKLVFYLVLIPFILYNIYLCSFFALRGEVRLTNDIGRDFLLLQELDQKKIVLIGPRSNTNGVFHGPLWTYINYPAYLIGNGDPAVVAWFWVILSVIFLLTTFFIVRKMFNTLSGLFATLLLSTSLVPHTNSVFSPESMFFFMPFFLFTIYKYLESKKFIFLISHLITVAIFVHLNIGVGILFLMLSSVLILGFILKNKLWKHLTAFLVVPVFLSNFIVFDLKNGFRITKGLLNLGGSSKFIVPLNDWISDRLNNTVSMQILADPANRFLVYIIFSLIVAFTAWQIKRNNNRKIYLLFLFYYFGYMALSYFNKGIILYHYIYVVIPLTTIWLVSFLKGHTKYIFIPLAFLVFLLNLNFARNYISFTNDSFLGKSRDSWILLHSVAESIISEEKGKEFGYFVYSPDAFAYQQRYAMLYSFKVSKAKAFEYVKKQTTYIISAPPPVDDPYVSRVWWREKEVKITSSPVETKKFSGGYVVEKFNLSSDEQNIPHDKNIELGIHFR